MKQVSVRYVTRYGLSDRAYAYAVSNDAEEGDLVVDYRDRVAIVTDLRSGYDGPVLEAQRLKTVLRAYRILAGMPA